MKLASQTRSGAFALGIRAMAHRAGLNAGFRNPFLIEFFPGGYLVLGGTLQRFGIQIFEMRRESRQHCGAESIRHCEHEFALAPALEEGLQLILQVLRLLSGEPWNRKRSTIAFA